MRILAPQDMVGLLEHIGLRRVWQKGDEVWASCPSHHDSGDSWSVNVTTGASNCFACGYAFDTLTELVMDVTDVDNFAANRLIRHYGLSDTIDVEGIVAARDELPEKPAPVVPADRFSAYTDAPDWALEERRLRRDAVDRFGVRWRPSKEHWILPVRTPAGKLLGWQEKGPGVFVNHPPGVSKGSTVFGAEHLDRCPVAVLVESPLDAVRLWGLGYNAFASAGAGVTDEQMRLLAAYADEILLALDNDEAGTEHMGRLASGYRFSKKGHRIKGICWASRTPMRIIRYQPDSPKDVGEMSDNEARAAIDGAIHVLDWLPTQPRENRAVQGRAPRVPARRRGAHAPAGRDPRRL